MKDPIVPDTMPAGDEMNRLISTEIMGLCWHEWDGKDIEIVKGKPTKEWTCKYCGHDRGIQPSPPRNGDYHDYSENIVSAWLVVEKLQDRYHWALRTPFDKDSANYHAGLTPLGVTGWNGRPDIEAAADTMPLAICRAAFKAMAES